MSRLVQPVTDPDQILEVYRADAPVHPYGIADVVQLWERSRWWRRDDAVVGVMDLPGSPLPVLYAVAARDPQPTLDLLGDLEPDLPDSFMATGPRGMSDRLAPRYRPRFVKDYVKMHLADVERLPPADPQVVSLRRHDLTALEELFDLDPIAGDFFWDGLLDSELYVGRWEDGAIVAAGGIHVIEPREGVTAIGNVTTHPAHRRRGLGRQVMATLSRRLLDRVPVVGLNVQEANAAARALYERVGFTRLVGYEEAELHRQRGALRP